MPTSNYFYLVIFVVTEAVGQWTFDEVVERWPGQFKGISRQGCKN
ncbi:MAG: hypothetical protein WD005_05220 [Haliea sp.]